MGMFDDLLPEGQQPQQTSGLFSDLMPEESQQTVIGSIGRGAGAGLVDIVQGITELGALGVDYAADTDYSRDTTEFFEGVKQSLGLTPERTAGRVVENIVNYGSIAIPFAGWVGAAAQGARAARFGMSVPRAATRLRQSAYNFGATDLGRALTGTRLRQAGTTALGTGVADFLVAPSTNETLADSWDALPEFLHTEDETGLTGRELATTRLMNKLRIGTEGIGFGAAGEALLPVVGATVRGVSRIPGVPQTARALSAGLNAIGSRVGEVPFVRKYLTSRGFTPQPIFDMLGTAQNITEADARTASRLLSRFDTSVKKAIRSQRLTGRGRKALQRAYQDTTDYLTGNIDAQQFKSMYGNQAMKAAEDMRMAIDDMSLRFADAVENAPNLTFAQKNQLLQEFQANQGQYMRRLYELHLRPEKFLGVNIRELPQYQAAREQVAKVYQLRHPEKLAEEADREAGQIIEEIFNKNMVHAGINPEQYARLQKQAAQMGVKEIDGVRSPLFKLGTGMLKDRSQYLDNAPMLREMMGEIRDPRELFLRTIDDMSSTIASQRLYDNMASQFGIKPYPQALREINEGGRPFIIDGTTVGDDVVIPGYKKLGDINPENPFGGAYGTLSGHYVPGEIYDALTTPLRAYSGMQDALAVALQAKGISQMTKTVLNPLSQIRNFLSNTFVVGANGNLGRDMGLFESADVLLANALNSPEQMRLLRALADEGAIGQNIQLNELSKLLQEQTARGVSAALKRGGDAFIQSRAGAPVRFMQTLYQGGDDYWKVVGALAEKSRYGGAFRKAGLDIDNMPANVQNALVDLGLANRTSSIAGTNFGDLFSIDIVRNTMPTYSMVPEAIKQLRRIPVIGNFMSFPAEIIRTSGNIVNRGLKEMGFKALNDAGESLIPGLSREAALQLQREIRAIGAQRMTGYVTMATMAPIAMREASHSILGITPEQEKLLESNLPFWMKGHTPMYISAPDAEGNAEYVDLSYMLPYEFMLTPARAALQEYQRRGEVSDDVVGNVARAAWEGFGKFVEPFASEGLAAERIIDVTTRQGRTAQGSVVYEQGEDLGDRLAQSLVHVTGAFMPGIVDQFLTIRGGEFQPGRVTRAITGMPSAAGDPYTVAEEVGTHLTGLRPLRLNTQRSLGYAASEYSSMRTSASRVFATRADDNDATAEDVLDAYVRANEARRSHQANLYARIQAARDAGMSDQQIRSAMRNSGISQRELSMIMRNQYVPLNVSRDVIREVANEVNVARENRILSRLPLTELNQIKQELRSTPLVSEGADATEVVPQGGSLFSDLMPSTPASAPAPTRSMFADLAPRTSAPAPTITVPEGEVGPAPAPGLLGSNPIDALRNLEIFQRTRGQ